MKKTYIAPLTKDVTVKVGEMVCTALSMSGSASSHSVTSADSKNRNFEDNDYLYEDNSSEWENGSLW